MENDDCEEVANDMAKAGLIMEEDARIVFKLLKSQLISLNRERSEKKAQMLFNQDLINEQNLLLEQQLMQVKMIQNQQQAGPVDQVNPGLLNGVGPQPTLAGVQLDQQSQLLQAQQQLFQHQLQLNNEETAMQLLQHNLMQARMSPSYGSIQQQVMMEQNLLNHQMLEQQKQVMMDPNNTQPQQQQQQMNDQQQVLQQQIIQQQQNIIAQQAAAIQQKQFEDQMNQENMMAAPQNLVSGQMLDPSLQNLQNILTQIIHRPDNLQPRKENEAEAQQAQQQQTQQMMNQQTENVDQQQQQEELKQKMQNLIGAQIQQQNAQFLQQNQQYMQPILNAVDQTLLAQQQQMAQAQQQISQAQQQLNMQKQMLAQQQLVLQQQMLAQQQLQMPGQTLSPQHIRNLQQQQYLAQQELQLQSQQNLLDQQNLALYAQQQQIMGHHQQKVEEILRAQRPMYQRQGSEQSQISTADVHEQQNQNQMVQDQYQQKVLQQQMSMDQIQYQNLQNLMQKQQSEEHSFHHQMHAMQGQSLPHNMMAQNFSVVQQNERQISSHEGTPVQNYTANPLQMYQQAQSQPMQQILQNMQYQVETSMPSSVPQNLPQSIQQDVNQLAVQSVAQPIQSMPQPIASVPQSVPQQTPSVQPLSSVPQPAQTIPQPSQSIPQSVPHSIPQPAQSVPQPMQSVPQPMPIQTMPQSTVPQSYPQQINTQPAVPASLPQPLPEQNLSAEHAENGYHSNGTQKEQFLTPLSEFPSAATHHEAIRQPELSSVEEKQAETQEVGTAIPSPIASEKKSRGSKKRSREKDKLPKLTVLEVSEEANVVECQLESKSKTVTFKFNVTDVNPEEIASNLVSNNLLPEWQSTVFTELIRDIVGQLLADPSVTPVLNHQHHSALRLTIDKTDYDSETTEREENLTDSNQDNSECTTPTASHDNIAAELAYDLPEPDVEPAPDHKPPAPLASRKISTASSIGSNQSDGGSMAPERSGSTESQNGEKKSQKPTRKISRFLVSPVVDRGEDTAEEPEVKEEKKEDVAVAVTSAPVTSVPVTSVPVTSVPVTSAPVTQVVPQENRVPTHQYPAPAQATQTLAEPAPQPQPQPPQTQPPPQPQPQPQPQRPESNEPVSIQTSVPLLPHQFPQAGIDPSILHAALQPSLGNLSTPLQIATDPGALGLQHPTPPITTPAPNAPMLHVGLATGLAAAGLGGAGLNTSGLGLPPRAPAPTPHAGLTPAADAPHAHADAPHSADNIQRMLLKQNIINQQQNLTGPNLLGLLNQPQFPQPDLALHPAMLNNAQPAGAGQFAPPRFYQPMLATANDFIVQQQALQTSVGQLAGQQVGGFLPPGMLAAPSRAFNQNLIHQNLGKISSGGQNLSLGAQGIGLMGQNLGQLVAHRAVSHALARRAVDIEMANMNKVNSTGSSQPSTPNKGHSYSEYMLSLHHKLASISNSGPVSPQSPIEYSPALSPTHRPLHSLAKSEGTDGAAAAQTARHAEALATLDHELSKISLQYKHHQPKDVFIDHTAEQHEMLGANINDSAVNTYEELGEMWESGSPRFRVSRATPLRGYSLCRLLPHHAKDKLDLSSGVDGAYEETETGETTEAGEAALDSASCNNSSCSDPGGDTYVITPRRPAAYLVHDALAPRPATIIDPCRAQVEPSKSAEASPDSETEHSFLVLDRLRQLTCAVIARSLALHADPAFSAFVDAPEAGDKDDQLGVECTESGPASEELATWVLADTEGDTAEGGGGVAGGGAAERGVCRARNGRGLVADLVIDETFTDKVLCRQVVLVSLAPAQL
ncbi:hypothetical protein ABMA28_010957 [Loxostege sticticalis]|uniref:non-specific serine/threonine protein kinase n=1 Tax=Loxostege sticticalis TaxID=481309 RepID=A0ABD0S7X1_LOXSC